MSSQKHASRHDYHLPRRIFHLVAGIGVISLALWLQKKPLILIVSSALCFVFVAFEYLRLKWQALNRLTNRGFQSLLREGEDRSVSGMPFYAFGVFISFVVFPVPIALLAVLYLSLGDPVASVVGCYFRRAKKSIALLPGKSLQGSLACALVCCIGTFVLAPRLLEIERWSGEGLMLAFVGGAIAALAELMPLRTDDNLSIPLVSGALLWLYTSVVQLMPALV